MARPAQQAVQENQATQTATSLPSVAPTATHVPQPTAEPETVSPLEEIVFGPCLETQLGFAENINIPWNLIGGDGENFIVLDVNTMTKGNLSYLEEVGPDGLPTRLGDIKISPDGKWIAYEGSYSKKNRLYIDSALTLLNQTEEKSIGLEIKQPYRLKRWVDADTLLIHYEDPEAPYLYLTSFFDPVSGDEYIFSIRDLPNYYDEDGGAFMVANYWLDGDLVPDPTMTRIIYPAIDQTDSYVYNILWDSKEEKIITRFQYMVIAFNEPFWALDGSDFIMRNFLEKEKGKWYSDWFLMSREGDYRQITSFMDFMEIGYYFDDISRSPDGRYLVFRLSYEMDGLDKAKYILLDIKSSELSGFCIDSSYEEGSMNTPVPWSPDSRYIEIDLKEGILIVNVEERTATKIAEDVFAYGWIVREE
ncbi:MAG: hypothetical protein CVU39_11860 [Chloroflexi bacterium HGW-Chloroflexi-10]|nr:MAG: hypothetical protein CVU39_11860 [Chloroflexi bacterium HGW-Chloroflexi-10]